jgi:hypothetical protein
MLLLFLISFIPSGKYCGTVITRVLPSQTVKVNVLDDNIGNIALSGTVNVVDNFSYYNENGEWNCLFGPKIQKVLDKYKCKIHNFNYDSTKDEASVYLKLPLIGSKKVLLEKEK